ncbi:pyruvate dehydrogenase (acetyl-transferring) E1 component subunit alpha [Pseudaeromonas sp. ZJS20]|uniref:pyruvate dehydrogenase (acetyl-transferring) E1 component subunit alpha n=1 Tax=Pseudaeromonas aegiceratis TaxID=3153928 RepID=UPI00390C746F
MNKPHLNPEQLQQLLYQMLRIRRFEERCAELYQQEKIRGFLHLYNGEEAVAVGVIQALTPTDALLSTYREHGHALARGVSMNAIMAELFGRQSGCSGGRGGSMHLFDVAHRFYGGNAIVAGGLPLAVGLALADKMQGRRPITACFFGDGATSEGEFHESLNLAALWQLPILFVCENNRYAMGTALEFEMGNAQLAQRVAAYGIEAQAVDGMNVVAVLSAAQAACEAIRAGGGPQFIECQTYRFRGHSMFDAQLYRQSSEIEAWKARCPIEQMSHWLQANHQLDPHQLTALEQQVESEIDAAVAFAEAAPLEPTETLLHHLITEESHE